MKKTNQKPKSKKKVILLVTGGVLGLSLLSYLGYRAYQRRKNKSKDPFAKQAESSLAPTTTSRSSSSSTATASKGDSFPLSKGSRGNRVYNLQQALINKYGSDTLPKYGADGIFGSETEAGLIKAGFPTKVNRDSYEAILKDNVMNAKAVAKTFYDAIISGNFSQAMFTLKGMSTTEDYAKVSSEFKNYRIGGVRKTLVNGLFDRFTTKSQKSAIASEFLRMGLKYDGSVWSLSGIPVCRVESTRPSQIEMLSVSRWFPVTRRIVLGRHKKTDSEYHYFIPRGTKETFRIKKEDARLLE